MESTRRPPHPVLRPRWLLALGSFIAAVVFLAAFMRRIRSSKPTQESVLLETTFSAAENTLPTIKTISAQSSSRGWIVRLFTVLTAGGALAAFVTSAVWFQGAGLGSPKLNDAFGMMLIGSALLGIPVFLRRKTVSLPTLARRKSLAVIVERINFAMLGVGLVSLAILTERNANILHIAALSKITTDAQFVLLCVGLTGIVLGLGGARILPGFWRTLVGFLRPSSRVTQQSALRVQHWLPIAIVLLAFGLRLWHLDDTNRFFIDELNHVSGIFDLFGDRYTGLLRPFSGIAAFPYLFPYAQKFSIEIFGHTYLGLRAFSAIMGTLGVAAVYRLGRALFDRPTALIAALLLATFPPHIHFSRVGINNIADPLFGTLALAFTAQGIRNNRRMNWVLGGTMLGLTHYFYEAGRLLFTPLLILWLVGLWLLHRFQYGAEKKSERAPGNWRMGALALVLVAAPIYITLFGLNRPATARLDDNQAGLDGGYWNALFQSGDFQNHINEHVTPTFAVFVSEPDSTLFYAGTTPMLLVAVAPFFLLGLAFLLWRWRKPGALLLLMWIVGASLGNTLMVQSTTYTRYVLVLPALILVTAVGIRYGLQLILGKRHLWKIMLIAVLTIGLAAFQTYYYFAIHIPEYNAETRNRWEHPDADDAILRSVGFPAGTRVHLISAIPADEPYYKGILDFMHPGLLIDTLTPEQLTPDYFRHLACGVDHAFFLAPNDLDSMRVLQQEFYLRQAVMSPYQDIPPDQQFALYYAPYWPGNSRPFPNRCQPAS